MIDIMTNTSAITTSLWNNTKTPMVSKELAKAEKSAEDFEAFFLTKMMESMYEGVSTDGMFGGGHAEKIYRSLLLDEYGKEMAKVGSIGVKDYVMNAILQMQEASSDQNIING